MGQGRLRQTKRTPNTLAATACTFALVIAAMAMTRAAGAEADTLHNDEGVPSNRAALRQGVSEPSERSLAAAETASGGGWLALALLGGAVRPDEAFANYQWDTAPRAAWGVHALAGRERRGLGLRMWRGATTQTLDFGSESIAPTVHHTSWELLGRARVAQGWGGRVHASASAGRIGLRYQPARIAFDPGSGDPIEVELKPVTAWTAAVGLALERSLARPVTLGLSFDTRFYSIETAHRDGEAIVVGRHTFEDWSVRAELAWLHRWKGSSR